LGRWIAIGVFAIAIIGGGVFWWQMSGAESEFLALAKQGQAAMSRIKTVPTAGGGHLKPGEGHRYNDRFPTSGIHAPQWTKTGVHDRPQPPTGLVHALEHGNIVIYYDKPGAEAHKTMAEWTSLYGGQWDGIVVTPMPGLGQKIVVTAWTKRLDLERFDAPAIAAMIDAFRGRGPEHPVR
jgi:hypothetical protein